MRFSIIYFELSVLAWNENCNLEFSERFLLETLYIPKLKCNFKKKPVSAHNDDAQMECRLEFTMWSISTITARTFPENDPFKSIKLFSKHFVSNILVLSRYIRLFFGVKSLVERIWNAFC